MYNLEKKKIRFNKILKFNAAEKAVGSAFIIEKSLRGKRFVKAVSMKNENTIKQYIFDYHFFGSLSVPLSLSHFPFVELMSYLSNAHHLWMEMLSARCIPKYCQHNKISRKKKKHRIHMRKIKYFTVLETWSVENVCSFPVCLAASFTLTPLIQFSLVSKFMCMHECRTKKQLEFNVGPSMLSPTYEQNASSPNNERYTFYWVTYILPKGRFWKPQIPLTNSLELNG